MDFSNNKFVILLFLGLFRCITEDDEKFLKEVEKYTISETYLHLHKNLLPKVTYNVELFRKTEKGEVGKGFMNKFITHNNNKEKPIEIYDESGIKTLIGKLKENTNCNYLINFFYAFGETELRKFVKHFYKRLEDNKIEYVEITYRSELKTEYLYRSNSLYIELENNDIVFKKIRDKMGDGIALSKIIFSKEYLLSEMEEFFGSYEEILSDSTYVALFRKYFFNHKLLSLNIDYLNIKTLLERFPSENKSYEERMKFNESIFEKIFKVAKSTKIKYKYILFHLLQDSATMNSMISNKTNKNDTRKSFYEMLEKFKTNYDEENVGAKEIIKSINIEDNIREYEEIANYFYSYLENIKFSNLNNLIDIIKIIVDNETRFKEINLKVFKKLSHHLNRLDQKHSESFNYDLFHEKKYIS